MEISSALESSVRSFHLHHLDPFLSRHSAELQRLEGEWSARCTDHQTTMQQTAEEKARLQQLSKQQQGEMEVEAARLAELERSVAALRHRCSTLLPAQIANLQTSVRVNEGLKQALEDEVAAAASIAKREIDAVTKGVSFFSSRLGVRFDVREAKLRIRFTKVSAVDTEREHIIAIYVDEAKMYRLHACTPEMGRADELIDCLNSTNNFAQFIAQVRKEFVKIAAEQDLQQQQ